MKLRHVYVAPNLEIARQCVLAVRSLGLTDADISLIARTDIELERIPDRLKDDSATDFIPAGMRGAVGGGGMGLLAGIVAAVIPPLGITVAGAAFMALIGAAVGSWASALVGSSVPSEVQRKFDDRIQAGEVLLVLNAEEEAMSAVDTAVQATGGSRLDHEVAAAMA